ncbi:MAG: ribosomal protein S18-alanine N-acetyltransferase [Gammaproteobacteria bacterium]|nr:MAG: ribosomal protein S18-alanine N-acetyltransferase [Gammaproteobacteria bacterium]
MSAVIQPLNYIRMMHHDDVDEIMSIETLAYPYPWTIGIFKDCLRVGYTCVVLESGDGIIGYGVMSCGAGEAHILNICVVPEQQCQGFGNMIVEYLIDRARQHHADIILLEVRPSNRAALAVYHKLGFNEVGSRYEYYPDDKGREDALILAMDL